MHIIKIPDELYDSFMYAFTHGHVLQKKFVLGAREYLEQARGISPKSDWEEVWTFIDELIDNWDDEVRTLYSLTEY